MICVLGLGQTQITSGVRQVLLRIQLTKVGPNDIGVLAVLRVRIQVFLVNLVGRPIFLLTAPRVA